MNEYSGFGTVLVAPSSKFQSQDVGVPEEASVNCTASPGAGDAGLKVKDDVKEAIGEVGFATVSVRLSLSEPDIVPVTRVTVYNPAAA